MLRVVENHTTELKCTWLG